MSNDPIEQIQDAQAQIAAARDQAADDLRAAIEPLGYPEYVTEQIVIAGLGTILGYAQIGGPQPSMMPGMAAPPPMPIPGGEDTAESAGGTP